MSPSARRSLIVFLLVHATILEGADGTWLQPDFLRKFDLPIHSRNPVDHRNALRHLKRVDLRLGTVIQAVGPCYLKKQGGTFALLARSILSQQISVAAARTIRRRLLAEMPDNRLTASAIASLSDERFAAAGVSVQKRAYLRDLATRVVDGNLNFRRLAQLHDAQVIEELIQVKGVGRWTAQMFLLFGLGRGDVFAPADLGLKNAMVSIYDLHNPTSDALEEIAACWSPYRSVASWYLWRSLE